jgi:hypothetical protein
MDADDIGPFRIGTSRFVRLSAPELPPLSAADTVASLRDDNGRREGAVRPSSAVSRDSSAHPLGIVGMMAETSRSQTVN